MANGVYVSFRKGLLCLWGVFGGFVVCLMGGEEGDEEKEYKERRREMGKRRVTVFGRRRKGRMEN